MEIFIYANFFIIGILLGSFFTLATYRIPLKQDIVHTRSYCPKCNNELKFLDLIPVLSYIFLKGKCRYCGNKIGARYIIIELLSGLLYLLFVMSLKINIFSIETNKIILLAVGTLYISALFILGGINKETSKIQKSVINFAGITSMLYIIYVYITRGNIYRYIIYFAILIVMYILGRFVKDDKNIIDLLKLFLIMCISTGELITIISVLIAVLCIGLNKLFKKNYTFENIVYYICFSNIIILIINNFIYLR